MNRTWKHYWPCQLSNWYWWWVDKLNCKGFANISIASIWKWALNFFCNHANYEKYPSTFFIHSYEFVKWKSSVNFTALKFLLSFILFKNSTIFAKCRNIHEKEWMRISQFWNLEKKLLGAWIILKFVRKISFKKEFLCRKSRLLFVCFLFHWKNAIPIQFQSHYF